MKPPARLFVNAHQSIRAARLLILAGAGAVVSGCVGNPLQDAQIDPASPVAAEVGRVARANTDYPSFTEIPKAPDDVRPKRMFGQAAREIELAAAKLERETAPDTWTLTGDTEAFAGRARQQAGPDIAPADQRDTEAYAEELRRRATPPPPPKR